jgi:hypothetical protein
VPICRLIVLTLLGVLWLWAGSVYSPWAEDLDPRLWLYDFLFYSGYILLFWVLVEAGLRLRRYRDGIASLRALFAGACLLVVSGLAVNLPGWIADTEIGWR